MTVTLYHFGSLSLAAEKRSAPTRHEILSREDSTATIKQRRLRILVVDDDDSFRGSMAFKLEDVYRASVVEADTGQTALNLVDARGTFDLILIDIMMPGMDGIQTSEALRARGVTTRIVLMSAYYDADKRARAQALGLTPLAKPVDADALEAILLECGEGKTE